MDVTQQQYMIALSEAGTVSEAARRLGVSQPAISNWLKNLEGQLGQKLVIRSKKGLVLTPAGQTYLEGARRMVEVKNDTYRTISRILGRTEETVVMAGTPNGGVNVFSRLYQQFKTRYPLVNLRFVEAYNSESFELVRKGEVDLALCSCQDLESDEFDYCMTGSRELILAVPRDFPMGYDASGVKRGEALSPLEFTALKDLPFVMPSPEMSYYEGLTQIFRQIGFWPNTILQSASTRMIYNMIRNGNAAGVVPRYFFSPLDNVSPFALSPNLSTYTVVVTKKGRKLSEAQKAAVEGILNDRTQPGG